MKNNYKKIIRNIALCLLILLADTGLCLAEPVAVGSSVVPIKTVMIKFGITMGSVLLSLIIIWSVLYSFKKYTADSIKEYNKKALYGDNFRTPTSMDDAIVSFINKNRL